ncbi:MAG: hypothetical protein A2860_04130 [Candidatus Levybacteria bacterium RIFCSPHIGHO2_01_FULL_37_33]|nr:MAG: hypothetical protein A2860_04130 [Candidatus Levybacteria bacterium RIFCSPHIGHO2_01_FULL_37_33]OGH29767.1 MAG: hypothetical protein A3F30_04030 [Candidatus Levybacteria bacterium RIFCSPHIGHO2_12_FULL_37_12]
MPGELKKSLFYCSINGMSSASETFFTSVGCMDGRSECAVAKWGRKKFGVEYADAITEAGLAGLLAQDHLDKYLIDSLENKIKISLEKHHSKNIVVSGHEDCAASNAASEEKHKEDILKAAELISLIFPNTSVTPVYVKRDGEEWTVKELK